jgi:hypothetical protein
MRILDQHAYADLGVLEECAIFGEVGRYGEGAADVTEVAGDNGTRTF